MSMSKPARTGSQAVAGAAPHLLLEMEAFSAALYEVMQRVHPGIQDLALYEFRYALHNLTPRGGWASVALEDARSIEERVTSSAFYRSLEVKPRQGDRIVLDERISRLTVMLLVGLVTGAYPAEWVRRHFYFDLRGFYFLHRNQYFTPEILAHLGGKPLRTFERRQEGLERCQSIGYKEFAAANADLDDFFLACVRRLIDAKGMPIILALAGPTAAGKTEIVERMRAALAGDGRSVTSIEMDNFLTDRDYREEKGIHTLGREAIHLQLFLQCLEEIRRGRAIQTPRYDFIDAVSSHDLQGKLKPGARPVDVPAGEIVFIEGNFPFLLEEVAPLIGIKVVYLTDDPIRMKRKWRRDIDYRRKYEPDYFRNRFFKEQFLMAEVCYRPQMEVCDVVVDTTRPAVPATSRPMLTPIAHIPAWCERALAMKPRMQ
jgi:uridine kinase